MLRKLAEPTRLRLVTLLGHGELTVGEICRVVEQSQPRVSRHLRLLAEAGFLDRFRDQQRVYYRAAAPASRPRWLNELLNTVDPDDPALQHDRARLADLVSKREKQAVSGTAAGMLSAADRERLSGVLHQQVGPSCLGDLLDIGSGGGGFIEFLGAQARRAVRVDLSAPALPLARERLQGGAMAHCEFRGADMYALAFPDQCFDTVTIDRVLSVAQRPPAVLAEAARVLRPCGRLVLADRVEEVERRTGRAPPEVVGEWLAGLGFVISCSRPFDLASGPYFLIVAQRS